MPASTVSIYRTDGRAWRTIMLLRSELAKRKKKKGKKEEVKMKKPVWFFFLLTSCGERKVLELLLYCVMAQATITSRCNKKGLKLDREKEKTASCTQVHKSYINTHCADNINNWNYNSPLSTDYSVK